MSQIREDRYRWPLLEVIQRLHMSLIGAGDPIPLSEKEEILEWLRYRHTTWESSISHTEAYDSHVWWLLTVVLNENKQHEEERLKYFNV